MIFCNGEFFTLFHSSLTKILAYVFILQIFFIHPDRMLEGWYFGERDTKDNGQLMEVSLHDQRGSMADRASSVQRNSNANAIRDSRANESAAEDLREVEKTMKYGLFCLTFMYFRALNTLRKEKASWSGANDLISLWHGPPLSDERKKIMQEEKNADFRKIRIENAMQKARAGEERWRQRSERERIEKVGLSVTLKTLFFIILNVSPDCFNNVDKDKAVAQQKETS
jgi:hypothetical protein